MESSSQNKYWNRVWRLGFKNSVFPKMLKQCHANKLCGQEDIIVWLVCLFFWPQHPEFNFFSPDENIAIQNEYCFRCAHWGRVTHICVSKLTVIGSDNGMSPDRRQAIIWTNAEILLIGPFGTKFNRNSNIFVQENAFESVVCEMAAISSRPQCVKISTISTTPMVAQSAPHQWVHYGSVVNQ